MGSKYFRYDYHIQLRWEQYDFSAIMQKIKSDKINEIIPPTLPTAVCKVQDKPSVSDSLKKFKLLPL